ncbi:transporter [Sulfuriflexus sp.]|uniref:transporter n=1 Tax=Sulfuriflexus sp. TaxID=2015443 RepID=UPI0028CF7BA2|nr:transporter [Sulfuriflexus sp.]MDT8404673.1 transporter [Sulfuriflexus sp.]
MEKKKTTTRLKPSAYIVLLGVAAGGLLAHPSVSAAPITFNTALPVAEGEFLIREQMIVNQSDDDPSGVNRDRTETAAVTALGYGISRKWAVFGVLPYRDINLDLDSGGQRVNRSKRGFGDLTVFTRYTAYQKDQPGRTFRVAPFIGVKAPTGEDNASDSLGTLPPPAQVASGSWDYFGGVVLTWQTLKYQADAQISYHINNEANGFEAGNIARLDGSYQHRLWRSDSKGIPDYLYGVIEVNLIHQDKNRISGNNDPNSNGTRLFLSPGIQYVTRRWIAEAAVQIPVSQELNGTALENDYIARAGFRFNF